jgi:hypothetical protein
MTPSTQSILQLALALPEEDRVTIADQLLESVGPDSAQGGAQPNLHPDWETEIARRIAAVDNTAASMASWEDVNREAQEIVGRAQTHST